MKQLKQLLNYQRYNTSLNGSILVTYVLALTYLSLKPHIDLGEIPYNDKLAHILGYGLFTLLGWRITRNLIQFIILTLCIFFYSGLIEIAQSYTGRTMSLLDLFANGTGIAISFFILYQESYSTK
jgi:VanZ family protein